MPKMPGAEQLGYVRPRVNTAIASADMSAIGRGAQQLGAGIANLAGDISDVVQENRRQKGITEASGANAFYAESVLAADREINNSPDYSTYGKTFDERSTKALAQGASLISDPKYREKWLADKKVDLANRRQSILGDADVKQKEAFRVNLGSAIEKDQNIFTDPATPEAEKNAALGRIRDSIGAAETTGLLDPVKAKQWRDTYENGSIVKEAELRVLSDPGFRKQVLRGDAPGADDLIDAVIGVESTGDPSQVSGKGAAGIMQVMPGTADEIARELGDANYPAGGTEAEKQAYLKNAGVGKTYGSHYLDKMLTRYNGDVDAALVAYNGGPARADAWIAAGKDDSVIPKETADYYKKVNGRLGLNVSFSPADVSGAKTFLKGRTDKDASHIDGLNDGFSVKVSRLFQSAPPAIKDKLGIFSGARSAERQQELWDAALKKYGSAAEARKWVAPPGRSEHQHGNAADLAYNGKSLAEAPKEVVDWLHQNAGAYGLKFPLTNENWHIEDAGTRGGAQGVLRQGRYGESMSPEQRQALLDQARRKDGEYRVERRNEIETVVSNAPAAILNTGQYTGQMPNQQQFVDAYGADGQAKYDQFRASVDTSQQVYNFQTLPADSISQIVNAAKPVSSGDDAALETVRYETLQRAAAETIKIREADPAAYVRTTFPNVQSAWEGAQASGDYSQALAITAATQQQLGIKNLQLLPKIIADDSVKLFEDQNKPDEERINAATGLIFSTRDPAQQRAVFDQLVAAGLPEVTEGAVEAYARGDEAAGRRLMQAAIIDPSKLPGVAPVKPADIDSAIQSQIMDEGQIGDIVYGLTDGTIDNQETAIRDAKLLTNAVNIRVRNGEALDLAVQGAAKDLYGDIQAVTGNANVNAQIVLPTTADPTPVLDGLTGLLPTVRSRLEETVVVPKEAGVVDGGKAVLKGVRSNYIENVMSEGYFKNSGNGFVFIDPFVGAAVAGADGRPLIFTDKDVSGAMGKAPPDLGLMTDDTELQPMQRTQEEIDQETYGQFAPLLENLSGGQ